MRRVLAFCQWKANWWDEEAERRSGVHPALQEGLRAYAKEQAATERRLAKVWEAKWSAIRARARSVLQDPSVDVTVAVEGAMPEIEVEIDLEVGEQGVEDNFADYDD